MPQRLRKLPRFASRRSLRRLNVLLARLAAGSDPSDSPLQHPPLFVVGAPRSGSTLLYQLLVAGFDVTYISNRHCRFHGAPALVERFAPPRLPSEPYVSSYGRTLGAGAPSECGEFWYRFFRKSPQYVSLAEADPSSLQGLRAAVRALGDASGRPVVFKNLICSLRLMPIGTTLPEALFLFIRRDLLANAESLVASRRAIHGDYGAWWSAEPPGIDRLRALPPHEQVVEQVSAIEHVITADRELLGEDRFLELSYEKLCEDARGTLAEIAEFAEARGVTLTRRRDVPERFEPKRSRIEEPLARQLSEYVRRKAAA
jgi:LPS sulfotransferase NodH